MSTTTLPGTGHGTHDSHGHGRLPNPPSSVWLRSSRPPTRCRRPPRKTQAAGYTRYDCFSPYPVGDAADAMNFRSPKWAR
ncbi:MAG: hypothetical protein U0792_16415 [Gemmataceae bacterium]